MDRKMNVLKVPNQIEKCPLSPYCNQKDRKENEKDEREKKW